MLKRQKVIQIYRDRPRSFVDRTLHLGQVRPGKSTFPSSQRHLEKARSYFNTGNPIGRGNFRLHARRLALGSRSATLNLASGPLGVYYP